MKKVLIIILSLLTLTMVGCTKNISTYQLPPERNEGTKVELTLLTTYNDQQYHVLLDMIRIFEKEHSDIKINVDRVPWGAHRNRITTALALGDEPDMAMVDMSLIPLLAERSAIIDLSHLGANQITEEYLEGAILSSTLKKSVWGIPVDVSTKLLFYNKGILDEIGVTHPDAQWSFEELAHAATQVSGKLEGVYGFHLGDSFFDTIPIFASFGASMVSTDAAKTSLNTPEAIEALEFIYRLVKNEAVPRPWTEGAIDASVGFTEEKYAFVLANSKLFDELKNKNQNLELDYGITTVPKGPAGSYSDVSGTTMVVFRSSQYPREAYEFMRFITSEEMQIKWANELGQFPVNKAAINKLNFEEHPHLHLFLEQFQRVQARPMIVDTLCFEEVFYSELEDVFNGVKNPDEALKDAGNRLNKLKTP